MALEQRALMEIEIPVGDADGEVAERKRRDVDAAGAEDGRAALLRTPDSPRDLGDQIDVVTWPPPPPSYETGGPGQQGVSKETHR